MAKKVVSIQSGPDAEAILLKYEKDMRELVHDTGTALLDRLKKSSEDMGDVADGLEELVAVLRTNSGGR